MVVPCYILDNPKRHLRKQMSEIAELLVAYRLPDCLFGDAKITVDIVVFQRKVNPAKKWQKTTLVTLPNNQRFYLADYFTKHPKHILGKLDTYEAYSYFEDRPRKGLKCIAPYEQVEKRLPQLIDEISPLILNN